VVALEQRVDLVAVPARIAELDRVAARARKRLQERREAFDVDRPSRRQLIQDRSERARETLRAGEEQPDRIGRILQLLHVRQVAARLHRVDEPARRAVRPPGEGFRFGEPIERVVDLDGIEPLSVIRQPPGLGELSRIKITAPMRILPARATDTYVRI